MVELLSRILIVDDNKDIHEDIKYILNSSVSILDDAETQSLKNELFGDEDEKDTEKGNAGSIKIQYKIDDAFQGEEAIRMVEKAIAEGYPYSLVFMDVRMPPGMDGIQAIGEIWNISPCTEVVICTAYSDYSWDQILLKLGQNDHLLFIRKPFDNVSVKQIALSMTTKWNLHRQNLEYIGNLESEVEKRTLELKSLVAKLQNEISLREEKENLLVYNAHYDSLTGLLNRRSFYSSISTVINRNISTLDPFALFFIDLDGFKKVNDVLGHDIGDILLEEAARRIQFHIAQFTFTLPAMGNPSNTSQAIFRLGGDEFTAIINAHDREKISSIASFLIEKVSEPYYIAGNEISISCSIGISMFPDDSTSSEVLLKYADISMYKAKKTQGIFIFHEVSGDGKMMNEIKLESDVRKALDRNQIDLYYQCLVNTRDELMGIQALVRWNHPEFGVLCPDDFIGIAEKSDQMIKIGEYILKQACLHLKDLHMQGYNNLFVLVNCTSKQFYDPNFSSVVRKAMQEADLDPKYLKLGLEEKFSIQVTNASLSIIQELSKVGVQFTLDGFGSAYPTFVFLKQIPRDTIIKINKAYVENIVSDTKNRDFLLAILDIIKGWNLNVIISGIETIEQKTLLQEKDCILQGYHFNIPKPFPQFIEDLKAIKPYTEGC